MTVTPIERRLSQTAKDAVCSEAGWRCEWCDGPGWRETATGLRCVLDVDHIVRLVDGGTDDRANLQALCKSCHRLKTSFERTRGARLQLGRKSRRERGVE